jgi:hypothetical protein
VGRPSCVINASIKSLPENVREATNIRTVEAEQNVAADEVLAQHLVFFIVRQRTEINRQLLPRELKDTEPLQLLHHG